MNYKKQLLFPVLIISGLLTGCTEEDEEISSKSYDITITNITNNQPLTPAAVIMHESGYQLWSVGSAVTEGLEVLAESGGTDMLIAEANADDDVINTDAGSGITTPGNSVSFTMTTEEDDDIHLSLALMLANTNDAFTGINAVGLDELDNGDSMTLLARVFDAGTESNDELNVPGSGGEGFNSSRDDSDKVTIHPGVVTSDDGLTTSLLNETQRWKNYAAKVVITRSN